MKAIFRTGRVVLCAIMTGVALLAGSSAFAQSSFKGKVIDSNGNAIIGAAVMAQGTTNGVVTDVNGAFEIRVAPKAKLEVSCIGFATQVVEATANMVVTLQDDTQMLEETVVVGYGTMKKSDVTGAMVSVTSQELTANPVLNAVEALQGKAAGVVVSTANMRPGSTGSIVIRGANALSTASPLVVIDGIVGQSVGLDMINPQDIESIDILKDASATAIYGARGGNGVILVTTKRGKGGKLSLNYSGTVTADKIYDVTPMMNAADYIEWRRWGYYYAGLGVSANEPTLANDRKLFTTYGDDPTAWANILKGWGLTYDQWKNGATPTSAWDGSKVTSTDWTQFTDRIGITQEHTLSASGGTDKFNAYVSVGYLNQTGTNIGQDFKRYTFRTSVDVKPVKWFSMGGSINARYSDQLYGIDNSGGIAGNIPSTLHAKARNIFSYALPYDSDGNRVVYPGGDSTIPTVVDEIGKSAANNLSYQFTGSFYAGLDFGQMWEPLKGLTFKSTFGPQFSLSQSYKYLSADCVNRVSQGSDSVSSNASKKFSWTIDNILNYNRKFGEHSFDVTLLQEAWSKMETTLYSMSGTGVALGMNQTWWGLNPKTVNTLGSPSYNSLSETQMASYMARVNYSWKNRYIATVSFRYDGASQLGEGHKWAGFPSVALGWRIDQEAFMKDVSWLDQLKLRAGWGRTGNYSVGVYATKDDLSNIIIVHGDSGSTEYYSPSTIANQSLGWETTDQFNVGVDFSFFKGRISGVVDVYRNYTNGLIFNVSLPSVSGYSSTKDNLGKVINRGFDLSLNTINISTSDFNWRSTLNVAFTKNKIVELQNGKEDMVGSNLFIGQSSSVIYTYESAGLWTDSAEDLAEMALFNANGHKFEPGMVRVVDQNNDHKIDANYDRVILGSSRPLWNLSFNNVLTYKNFDLSILLYGNFGFITSTGQYQGGREPVIAMEYYNENNKNNITAHMYQRPYFNTAGGDSYSSYRFQADGSFLKVRQIALGYNLPRKFVNSLGLSNVKVSAQLKNPFSIFNGAWWTDGDLGSTYNKSLVFGLNIGF